MKQTLTRVACLALLVATTACGKPAPAEDDPVVVLRTATIEKLERCQENPSLLQAFTRGYQTGKNSRPGDIAQVSMSSPADVAYADGFYAAQLLNQSELEEAGEVREQIEAALRKP